jgi:ATP-dependent DNA helicase RecQ
MGAVFREHTPLHARNAESVKKLLPTLANWGNAAQFICGHNALAHDVPIIRKLGYQELPDDKVLDTLYLSPLAFPKKPYHALIKDGKICSETRNNPVQDSRSCAEVLKDCLQQFKRASVSDLEIYWLAFHLSGMAGMAKLFEQLAKASGSTYELGSESSNETRLLSLFTSLNEGRCCLNSIKVLEGSDGPIVLAYIHSWLKVAGGESVLPYWLCRVIPRLRPYLKHLRQVPCNDPGCAYCVEMHSPTKTLQKHFGFESFRAKPALLTQPDRSLQEEIVSTAMAGRSLLGILPTGGGKSLCFQIPALYRYECTGALSIVISPLQSLMRDQVENLKSRAGVLHTNALYGLLTPLERKACLEDIRLGHIGLLYVSPEQLRSPAFRKAILCREIGYWVFDEAHCLSKWGHDFRTDYLYASKFIRELAQEQGEDYPPILCVTATAKEAVKNDLIEHFREELDTEIRLLDGGTDRQNLKYSVEAVEKSAKLNRICDLLEEFYGTPSEEQAIHEFATCCAAKGAVVIFAATRKHVMELFQGLSQKGWPVLPFHSRLDDEKNENTDKLKKKYVLDQFLGGHIPIIVATNAFGMGVDKPDIRIVIHADATGSLENYLQEAGRAGRDGEAAECILLYEPNDLETQFNLAALSKISQRDIQGIWRAIYKSKPDAEGAVTLSTTEIKEAQGRYNAFNLDSDDLTDTNIKAAVALLERRNFLERKENRARVFEARALITDINQAREKIEKLRLPIDTQKLWIAVLKVFWALPNNECADISAFTEIDEMQSAYDALREHGEPMKSIITLVFRVLNQMARPEVGLLKKDILFSAFLQSKMAPKALTELQNLETSILKTLQEADPDATGRRPVRLKQLNELLNREGIKAHPDSILKVFQYLEKDGGKLSRNEQCLDVKQQKDRVTLTFKESWDRILDLSHLRLSLCDEVLKYLIALPPSPQSENSQTHVEFPESELIEHLKSDVTAAFSGIPDLAEAIHYALLWLHENKVIELQNGKALITSAMTLYMRDHKRGNKQRRFSKSDYEPLRVFYDERNLQIHIVGEYARKAIEEHSGSHLQFVEDYFKTDTKGFIKKYFKGKRHVLDLSTGIESYRKIYESLNNPAQQAIVAADEANNDMVLAGPGSGKTRVIAHRCAWLLRVRRVKASSIVVLCFNRHAALELRRRIWKLVGASSAGVIIQTFHGLALRILGRTMAQLETDSTGKGLSFNSIIPEAIDLLKGKSAPIGMEADAFRTRLIGNLTHILVDEYQDIEADAYEFVGLLAGKAQQGAENRLQILAVGDDDQSIYQFAGANVEFIRRFQDDYADRSNPKFVKDITVHYLTDNYRSTKNIIAAANAVIAHNTDRMKTDQPIQIDPLRFSNADGGHLEDLDTIGCGKVQILKTEGELEQAVACVEEIQRYVKLSERHQYEQCCVIARTNKELLPIRIALETANIPCSIVGAAQMPNLARVREVYNWLHYLKSQTETFWTGEKLMKQVQQHMTPTFAASPTGQLLKEIASEFYGETNGIEQSCADILDFFYEALHEHKRRGSNGIGVQLSTAHKAKGLEFDCVLILDGSWCENIRSIAEMEEARRLYYVSMTRSCKSLNLFQQRNFRTRFIQEIPAEIRKERNLRPIINDAQALRMQCDLISLEDLWINYAAYLQKEDPRHRALNTIERGDIVTFHHEQQQSANRNRLVIQNSEGITLAVLSKHGYTKWLPRLDLIEKIVVVGVHIREREDGEGNNKGTRESWSIPIFEVYSYPKKIN